MKPIRYILIFVFIFTTISSFSQTEKKQVLINSALAKENIKIQFNVLIENSPTFQNFKNIKHFNLNKFKTNFIDSLQAFDKKYNVAVTKIEAQKNEIEKLKSSISSINTNLNNVTEEKNNIELFGAKTTKTAYNSILWSAIIGLLFTTLFFLFKFKSSNISTKEARSSFSEIESELEIHRKKSLEREQVLRRKLQDEINKQRNV